MKSLIVVSSLTLIIGFCLGALSMIVLRPERQTEIADARSAAQVPAAQEPAPKPLPKAAPDDKRYPGSILVQPPKEIPAADVKLIRNYLRKQTNSGVWEEIEWTRKDIPAGEEWDLAPNGKTIKVPRPAGYNVALALRMPGPFGSLRRDVSITVEGAKIYYWPTDGSSAIQIRREDYP